MSVIIYHNPRCSKSRQTLALIHDRGIEPQVVEYLQQPPSTAELKRIIALLGIPAHALVRSNETEYRELGLSAESSEAKLVEAMHSHPRLIQRPIVIVGDQARIGRPPEQVNEILP
jgi:arsenate reductase (glutaredoxin)